MIKQSLIFELVNILYILYKSNQEFTSEYKISQYLLMDYFIASTRDKVPYLPINVRQTLVSIRNTGIDNDDGIDYKIPEGDTKYNIFKFSKKNFVYIPQTQITTQAPPYADCGERVLLNTFNYFLLEKDGSIHIRESWNERLKIFYGKWNNIHKISNQSTMQEMKNDWAQVIENIPEFNNTDFYANHTYNIHPSLDNIIKICKFLLNLEGDITIKEIISNLDLHFDIDDLILYNVEGFDCIKYKDIVIELNFGHAEFKSIKDVEPSIYLGKNYINFFTNIDDISDDKKTKELCILAFQRNPEVFQYIPDDKKTSEMYLLAVQKNIYSFQSVPRDKKTPELCLLAVEKDANMFRYVPPNKRTPKMCLLAVEKNVLMFEFVPDDEKTPELCLLAVKKDANMFRYVPPKKRTPELCLLAVEKDASMFHFVPDDKRTPEICLLVFRKNVEMFQYIPDDKKTHEMCLLAVQKYVSMFQFVPDGKKTSELCLLAVKKDAKMFKYVPPDEKTTELCLLAVQKYEYLIEYVPEGKKDQIKSLIKK